MIRLVRTFRRDPGSALRSPGPWHVLPESGFEDLTWCGRRPGRMVASQHGRVDAPMPGPGENLAGVEGLPEGRYCVDCQAAIREGRRRSYRKNR